MMFSIIDFLPFGEENAITMEELAIRMNCRKREARAAIHEARRRGAIICSTPNPKKGGYFQPVNNNEVERYILFQKSRINAAKEASKSAREFLKRGGFQAEDG